MKTNKIFIKIVTLSLISMGIIYASILIEVKNTLPHVPYCEMEIEQLQREVERHSENGDLPFDMGLELIKRWSTQSKKEN